jgi:hypothetical protein
MKASMGRQQGITLTGVLVVGLLLLFLASASFKIVPGVIDYFTLLRDAKATAQDPSLQDAAVPEIRRAFEKRIQIDRVTDLTGKDLDISKEGREIVIAFAYSKKIPLFANASLLLDFEGSTSGTR